MIYTCLGFIVFWRQQDGVTVSAEEYRRAGLKSPLVTKKTERIVFK